MMENEQPLSSREAFEEAIELLRSDRSRGFSVDIETDTMVFEDRRAERQARVEFITAVSSFLQQAVPAATMYPGIAPVLMQILMFGVRGFKVGRELEQVFDEAADELSEVKPQQGQSPDQQAQQAEQQKAQMDARAKEQDAERKQREADAAAAREAEKMRLHREDLRLRREADLEFEREKLVMQRADKQQDRMDQGLPAGHDIMATAQTLGDMVRQMQADRQELVSVLGDISQRIADIGQEIASIRDYQSAPVNATKDRSGKIVTVEKGGVVRQVVRRPDGISLQ